MFKDLQAPVGDLAVALLFLVCSTPDPVSVTASILGIVQGVAFLSSTIENIRSAPESIKNIQRQLQHLKPVLTQLAYAVDQKRIDTDQFGAEIKSALDNCDQACTEFSTSLGHWTRHSSEDETSVLDYTKIGLLRQGRIRLMKDQLDQCIKILNVTLATNNALQMSRQEGMIKELRDHKLLSLEASLKTKIDEVQKDKMEVVKYEVEVSGSSETDDKQSFTSEIERHKTMVQISEKVCKKALDAVIIERTQQKISDVCAAEESTALAGKFNVDGPDMTGQDITKVHAENRSFAVADKVPKTGKQIGWYLPELAHPFHVLNPLAELVYATPKGGESPLDPVSVELFKDDPVCKDFLENHESVWKNTLKLSDVAGRASEFDAIFYPGGHGPMVDLVDDEHSKSLLRDFHSQDKVIAAVCHGPAAFVNATTASEMFKFTEDMDFSLEKRLGEASGGKYVKADEGPLAEKVVVDGKMITGQNPASSKGVAEEIAKALGLIFYHELMLTLGRHPISQCLTRAGIRQTSSSHEVADISVLHAAATTKLLHQVYQEYEILNGWYEPVNCQWNAAITLVGYLLACPQDSRSNTIARTALSQSIKVLEKMGEFLGTASSAAGVIRTLHQRLNMTAEVYMTADSIPDTVQDMDLADLGALDLSFEGILGTFGTESEFEGLGFGIDMQDFLANDAENMSTA
ncbi:hypothetical protein FBULB1_8616 [Fusarium bulbicola]|nr:hypothetical protein FBULB1_8616 [Fusarium bulbicola]